MRSERFALLGVDQMVEIFLYRSDFFDTEEAEDFEGTEGPGVRITWNKQGDQRA